MGLAGEIARKGDGSLSARLFAALGRPFAVSCSNSDRLAARLEVARCLDGGVPDRWTREALEGYGPSVPWEERVLMDRALCYERLHDPRAQEARRDLETWDCSSPWGRASAPS